MGKKSRLKAERANSLSSMPVQPPAPAWAGILVTCLGIGFILTSLLSLWGLMDFAKYRSLCQDYSEGFIQLRYFISLSIRLLVLIAGVGLCFRKEWFRRATLFLFSGGIAVAYWRHPYAVLLRNIRVTSDQMAARGVPFSPESVIHYLQAWNVSWATEAFFAKATVLALIVIEVFAALCVIFILTRSSVKSLFR